MKLVTRSDFDGLACGALLKEAGVIDSWQFAHPKDLQDGKVAVDAEVVLANVPYVEGAGLWFDHHTSELERNAFQGSYQGDSRPAPSAARVVFDYYGGKERFNEALCELVDAADKVDSGNLTPDEVLHPQGWVLIGFIMDPRTGLGRFRDFTISNYALMSNLIEICRTTKIEDILHIRDVRERINCYVEQQDLFRQMVLEHTVVREQIIITDLTRVKTIYTGNRFYIYSLFPQANLSVWIVSGKGGEGCSAAVGHSIINRTAKLDVGSLMLTYGGGGHPRVGTCQFDNANMRERLSALIEDIVVKNR